MVVVVAVVGSFLHCLENFTNVNMYLNRPHHLKLLAIVSMAEKTLDQHDLARNEPLPSVCPGFYSFPEIRKFKMAEYLASIFGTEKDKFVPIYLL